MRKPLLNSLKKQLAALLLLATVGLNAYAALDVTLTGIDGKQHKVSQYIGQGAWVVLNIWGTHCPPCRDEMPELVRFHDENKDANAIILGIAVDFPSYGYADKEEVSQFADDYLIDFPLLLSDASITKKLGLGYLEGLPSTFIFNPKGKVVGKQVGAVTQKMLEQYIKKLKLKE
jgi:thiol-disulfide isomerase/thioredoxin